MKQKKHPELADKRHNFCIFQQQFGNIKRKVAQSDGQYLNPDSVCDWRPMPQIQGVYQPRANEENAIKEMKEQYCCHEFTQ
ncbi:MAG: hypothetical protein GX608_03315 [Lentisphaerae bacterium]|nr:hypothetical protein [Lentisphaerota bacterium]